MRLLLLLGAAAAALASSAGRSAAEDAGGCAASKWPVAAEQKLFEAPGLPTVASGGAFPLSGRARA